MNKDNAINNAKIKINSIEWYVPHYTPSISNQAILSKQILSKVPKEIQHVENSVFMEEVTTQNLWNFELGPQEGIIVPIWTFVGFQQGDRANSQYLNNDTSYRPSVSSAQCIVETKK